MYITTIVLMWLKERARVR